MCASVFSMYYFTVMEADVLAKQYLLSTAK